VCECVHMCVCEREGFRKQTNEQAMNYDPFINHVPTLLETYW